MRDIDFSASFPTIDERRVIDLEETLNMSFPQDYRNFLLSHNGGHPSFDVFPIRGHPISDSSMIQLFFGIANGEYDDLSAMFHRSRGRIPANLVPIARDYGGNLICLALSSNNKGRVFFWEHEGEAREGDQPTYGNIYLIAESFNALLNSLTEDPG
jgi:hypothetical protein